MNIQIHKTTVLLFLTFAGMVIAADDPAYLNNVGTQLYAAGQYRAAEAPLRRAIELWSADKPVELEAALHNLAAVYRSQGRYSEAEPLYWRCIALREARGGVTDLSLISPLSGLALMYLESSKLARAKDAADRATSIARMHADAATGDAANAFASLGSVLSALGRHSEARLWLGRALSIREQVFGPQSMAAAGTLEELALACRREHRFEESAQSYRQAVRLYQQNSDATKTASATRNLAELLVSRHKYAEANELLVQSEMALEGSTPAEQLELGWVKVALANLRMCQRRAHDAAILYREALNTLEPAVGSGNPRLLGVLEAYARVLRVVEDYATAAAVDMQAMKIRVQQSLARQG
jgi:tetratricopeptide (TPR) repeat protein